MMKLTGLCRTLAMVLMAGTMACATARPGLDSSQSNRRLTNTPREKLAAMPVPDPAADPDNQDQRFGIESARERRELAKQKKAQQSRCVDVVSAQEAGKPTPPCPPAKN